MKNAFKKALLVSIAICCLVTSYAQDSLHKKTILSPTIEVTGGANLPLYRQSAKKDLNIGMKLQYAIGLQVGLDIVRPHGIFAVQTGAIVNSHDFSTNNRSAFSTNLDFRSVFVNIPFIFSYHYRVTDKFMINASVGYIVKQLAQYKMSYSIPGFDITNKTMHGITAAVGFSYVASPHFSLRVEPVFEYFWWKYDKNLSKEYQYKLLDAISSPMIGLRFTLKYNILKEYN